MRLALPVGNGVVSSSLALCQGFQFYEDDHGRIIRQFFAENSGISTADAVAVVERYGVDALIAGSLSSEEREELALAGIVLFAGYSGDAQAAALRFLSGTVTRDPSNTCNACGVNTGCSMDCESCSLHPQ